MDNGIVDILILAAGSSSRMGSPKQLLEYQNKSFINRAIDTAQNSLTQNTHIVLGAHVDLILPEIENEKVNIYQNPNWKLGMGNSLSFAVKEILDKRNLDALLIMLVDQPLLESLHLNKLISKWSQKDQIVAATYNGEITSPVIFGSDYFDQLMQLNGDKGAKKIVNENLSKTQKVELGEVAKDYDTIEDYENLI